MKRLITAVLCFGVLKLLGGQSVSITGTIYSDNESPVEFANVLLYNADDAKYIKGTLTEMDGSFELSQVEVGEYFIEVSQLGFASFKSKNIVIDESTTTKYRISDITITEGLELDEVIVSAQKPLIELETDKVVVNVANSSVDVGNTALEVLQKSPGVTVDQDNSIALKGKQGVLILIDGKNQYVSNEQLSRLLETMPANSIEKIEIMHNPSAKYEAAGNAGVINIKLKKNENLGTNGTITVGAGHGKFGKANAGTSLNFRTEKLNIYGNSDFRYWKGFQDLELTRTVPTENGLSNFSQESRFDNTSKSNNYKGGIDYYLSDKTTVGALFRGSFGNWNGTNLNHTAITGENIQGFGQSDTYSDSREDWDQLVANFNVKHQISETSDVNLDFDYSTFNNPTIASYENFFFDDAMNPVMAPFFLNNDNSVEVDIIATKADYSKSFASGLKLESGMKYSDVTTDNNTIFKNLEGEEWVEDPNLTNSFTYDEKILAGYLNMSKSIGKFMVQGGLRVEKTSSDGFSATLNERVERSYTNFFPSLSVSHEIGEKHSLSYSYSRRVDRPTYRNLNPFIYFLDQFTFQKGNPFLNPQFTNTLGMNYGLGRSLFVSLNYSHTTDAMTEVIDQNNETQQTFQTMLNLDDYKNYSLNVTAPIVVNELWTTRLSFTGFINDFKSELNSGTLDKDQASYRMNVNNEFAISKKFNAELSAWYQSPIRFGIFVIEPRYTVDLGFTLKVMDGLGRLKLSAKDVVGTLHNEVNVQQDNIDLVVNSDWESQRVNLAFSYNFGNQKVKSSRRRSTANSDEEARVSRNN